MIAEVPTASEIEDAAHVVAAILRLPEGRRLDAVARAMDFFCRTGGCSDRVIAGKRRDLGLAEVPK